MNDPSNPNVFLDGQGRMYSEGCYREGFPSQLWGILRSKGYTMPPQYVGTNIFEAGVRRCEVSLLIPDLHNVPGEEINILATGGNYENACDNAAWRALQQFCAKHRITTYGAPAGVFSMPPANHAGEASSSQQQDEAHNVAELRRYVDNLNRMAENNAYNYGSMMYVAREQGNEAIELQEQVHDDMNAIAELEANVVQLQEENNELQEEEELGWLEPVPPPEEIEQVEEELPEQGESDLDEELGEHIDLQDIGEEDMEENGNGNENEGEEEEEEPEEVIYYTDDENSD
ncbi:unnamed protein product [Urochloa humidicola]